MKASRMLGNFAEHKIKEKNIAIERLEKSLNISKEQIIEFYEGRYYLSFVQLKELAKTIDVSIETLLHGDEQEYNSSVVHCMNDFQNNNNREQILDLIDDYLDIYDAIEA